MKKLFSLLAGVMTLTVMGTSILSASAALTVSDRPEYDLYAEENTFNYNGYSGFYFKFTNDNHGKYYDYAKSYQYVFIDVSPDVDMDALIAVLGEEPEEVLYYDVAENQHAFMYSADVDYESLYDITGVEKVQLAKSLFIGDFGRGIFWVDDNWMEENELTTADLAVSLVKTEPGVELTLDMFADSSFNVRHVEYNDFGIDKYWSVYYDFDGMRSYTDFDAETEKMEGVISSAIWLSIAESGSQSLAFDLVAKAQEGSTEPSTEPPTDAPTDLPTEAETAAPTEAPTNAPTEAPTNAPTEAPTNAPTEASANASADASTVSNPQTGDANTYKLVMGLAVLTAAGAGILIKTKKEKE